MASLLEGGQPPTNIMARSYNYTGSTNLSLSSPADRVRAVAEASAALPKEMNARAAAKLHENAIDAFDKAAQSLDETTKPVKFKTPPSIIVFGEKNTGGTGFSDGIDNANMDVVFHKGGFYYQLPLKGGSGTAVMVPVGVEIKDGFKRAITREKDLKEAGKHLNINWQDLDDVVRQNANQWFNRKG